ncbi:Os05g0421750, partial [Oryza sativa Japonica Group]
PWFCPTWWLSQRGTHVGPTCQHCHISLLSLFLSSLPSSYLSLRSLQLRVCEAGEEEGVGDRRPATDHVAAGEGAVCGRPGAERRPLVAFSLKDRSLHDEFEIDMLRRFGWIVPAYTMPPDAMVLRFVIREEFSRTLAERLVLDIEKVMCQLDALPSRLMPPVPPAPPSVSMGAHRAPPRRRAPHGPPLHSMDLALRVDLLSAGGRHASPSPPPLAGAIEAPPSSSPASHCWPQQTHSRREQRERNEMGDKRGKERRLMWQC